MSLANVHLWGRRIGAVNWDAGAGLAHFEYDPEFIGSGIEIAPLTMKLSPRIYSFPALPRETFRGLPGLLADSLPDDFGNALIDAWLVQEGRAGQTLNAVERLCYTGTRGMGALEYQPAQGPSATKSELVDVAAMVDLASAILSRRASIRRFSRAGEQAGFPSGDPARGHLGRRSPGEGHHRLESGNERGAIGADRCGEGLFLLDLKFDGVSGNRDKELVDPVGYGLIEYAYHKMAKAAGIDMMECRLLKENGRSHFMTRRFDRTEPARSCTCSR